MTGTTAAVTVFAAPSWAANLQPLPDRPAVDPDKLKQILWCPQVIITKHANGSLGVDYRAPLFLQAHEIPTKLKNALIAVEDKRFRERDGARDIGGIARAVVVNIMSGRVTQGASTLQQQLLKNTLFGTLEKWERKGKELFEFGTVLDQNFDKEEILALYLNWAPFQRGVIGVEAAAREYFGKHVSELSDFENAQLIGMLKSPRAYHPTNKPVQSRERAKLVLQKQVENKTMSEREAKAALAHASRHGSMKPAKIDLGYFYDDFIRPIATGLEGSGPWRIFFTLDCRRQLFAQSVIENAIRDGAGRGVEQGVLIELDAEGHVLAYVGGRDYAKSQFRRCTQMRRDAGSTAKAFAYLAAVEAGFKPDTVLLDEAISTDGWPSNFDGTYKGRVSMQTAFAESRNAASVQLARKVGVAKVADVARRAGLGVKADAGLGIALGSFPVCPLDLAAAYGCIANGGYRVAPVGVVAVLGPGGEVLQWLTPQPRKRIFQPKDLAVLGQLLRAAVTSGTGHNAAGPIPVMGKTGTTSEFKDAWFVGIATNLRNTALVWLGNDDFRPMNGVSGGTLPAKAYRSYVANTFRMQTRLNKIASSERPHSQPPRNKTQSPDSNRTQHRPSTGMVTKAPKHK